MAVDWCGKVLPVLCVVVGVFVLPVQNEFHRSEVDAIQVTRLEEKLIEALEAAAQVPAQAETRNTTFKLLNLGKRKGREKYLVSNPIFMFQMVKRFYLEWNHVVEEMGSLDKEQVLELMDQHRDKLPDQTAFHEAAEGLMRIQKINDLDIGDLAEGIIGGVQTEFKLSAEDLTIVGNRAFELGQVARATEWLEEAWSKVQKEDVPTIPQEKIQELLLKVAEQHDARVLLGQVHPHLFPKVLSEERPRDQRKKEIQRRVVHHYRGWNDSSWDKQMDFDNYHSLCQGIGVKVDHSLKCYLSRMYHPYNILRPWKVELLNREPHIVRIFDFFPHPLNETLKEEAFSKLYRREKAEDVVETNRAVAYGAVSDDSPPGKKANLAVKLATGFHVGKDCSENLKVGHYLVTGHNNPHADYTFKELKPDKMHYLFPEGPYYGERIATMVSYLNDVELGGETIFTRLNLKIEPIAGSTILFPDVHPNGHADRRTYHASCPVLIGSKWFTNHAIREGAQIFNKPCLLNEFDDFRFIY